MAYCPFLREMRKIGRAVFKGEEATSAMKFPTVLALACVVLYKSVTIAVTMAASQTRAELVS